VRRAGSNLIKKFDRAAGVTLIELQVSKTLQDTYREEDVLLVKPNQASADLATEGISRRRLATAGSAMLISAFAASALAQEAPPTPEDLERELPSPRKAPPVGAELPELPTPEPAGVSERLFPGFRVEDVKTNGATIHVLSKGSGPPLLLLHGHPETHVTWHKVAPALADRYSIVVPDLRGYGDSSKPDYSPRSARYSFRDMAEDMVEVMGHLGYKQFMVAGHDRGGRVVHRMMLDYPDLVTRGAVLDIAPTLTMYDETSKEFATKYVWWFLQIQPAPMPEHLIGLDPGYYLRDHLAVQGKTPGAVTPEAMAEYIRCYCCKGTIRAVCEDYRAAAGIDLDQDRADDQAGRKIRAPLLALWGAKGTVGKLWDVLATWRPKTQAAVEGQALPCGHLIPEEQPEEVISQFRRFFA
jgi:haloacetate dehalogenase